MDIDIKEIFKKSREFFLDYNENQRKANEIGYFDAKDKSRIEGNHSEFEIIDELKFYVPNLREIDDFRSVDIFIGPLFKESVNIFNMKGKWLIIYNEKTEFVINEKFEIEDCDDCFIKNYFLDRKNKIDNDFYLSKYFSYCLKNDSTHLFVETFY